MRKEGLNLRLNEARAVEFSRVAIPQWRNTNSSIETEDKREIASSLGSAQFHSLVCSNTEIKILSKTDLNNLHVFDFF
jgi:hypothetical protein